MKQKYIVSLLLVFAFSLISALPVLAQDDPADTDVVPATEVDDDQVDDTDEQTVRDRGSRGDRLRDRFERTQDHVQALRDKAQEKQDDVRERAQSMIDEKREEIRQKWENKKAQLDEARKERISRLIDRLGERFQAIIDRLGALAEKVGNRITTWSSRGVDVTNSQALLDAANDSIAQAQATFDSAKVELGEITDAANPGEAFEEARIVMGEVKDAIKSAKEALVEAIKSLKGLSGGTSDETNADEESEE